MNLTRIALWGSLGILSGCFNSSDNSDAVPAPAPAPVTANAGVDLDVIEGELVVLEAQDRQVGVTYQWSQITQASLVLEEGKEGSLSVTAPETDGVTILEFQLVATAEDGRSAMDSVQIDVHNQPLAPQAATFEAAAWDQLTVDWALDQNSTRYRLTYSSDNQAPIAIEEAQPPITLTGLASGTNFRVQVESLDDSGHSSLSPEFMGATKGPHPAPAAVDLFYIAAPDDGRKLLALGDESLNDNKLEAYHSTDGGLNWSLQRLDLTEQRCYILTGGLVPGDAALTRVYFTSSVSCGNSHYELFSPPRQLESYVFGESNAASVTEDTIGQYLVATGEGEAVTIYKVQSTGEGGPSYLYVSTDGGSEFTLPPNQPFEPWFINYIGALETAPLLLAANSSGTLITDSFLTRDAGQSWQATELPDGVGAKVSMSPKGESLYHTSTQPVALNFRALDTDGWESLTVPASEGTLTVSPFKTGELWWSGKAEGAFRSSDNGTSWLKLESIPDGVSVEQIFVSKNGATLQTDRGVIFLPLEDS